MSQKVIKGGTPPLPTKRADLDPFRNDPGGMTLTTDQGIPIEHTDDSLKAGLRGPSLLEDFHLREKITRFDHERIPERVVHARGSAAHGYFQVYESLENLTQADFLCDPAARTPVFVRFSTVVGSRGSADTARDVRGFATKFYTSQGNFDLVGNNIPVFFIQDGIKFPDLVHAVKPEPHHEMPQAASAHDNFWDFVSLVPETAHMVMWVMSDRALPRSYRHMEGFGVHTFKLINAQGKVSLCKFHWKPVLGAHSLVWDEAQKISGKDPDFHRRDLWESIEKGHFPEYELGLQIIDEDQELAFGFDLLDPTKLIPEEVVPVRRVGKLVLDRNPDNFFAETEQVAFCVQNVVPGIDFTNDPLMQARLFSYLDTQLTRLGGPNFHEIPINKPVAPVHNHQQDGFHRDTILTGVANYHPNSTGGGYPVLATRGKGFVHAAASTEGPRVRARSETFSDHFSQATMFLASQSAPERAHLVEAFRFELGKVKRPAIRERALAMFAKVDEGFARQIAAGLGMTVAVQESQKKGGRTPSSDTQPSGSPALSLATQPKTSIKGRKVAILATDGVRLDEVESMRVALAKAGACGEVVAHHLGSIKTEEGELLPVVHSLLTTHSVLFDALYLAGGGESVQILARMMETSEFIRDAFRHCKVIGATSEGAAYLAGLSLPGLTESPKGGVSSVEGIVTAGVGQSVAFGDAFVEAMKGHRYFSRQTSEPERNPGRGVGKA